MGRHPSEPAITTPEAIEIEGQRFTDPFDIPATISPKFDSRQCHWIFRTIDAKYGRMILKAFRKPDVGALLLCDREVVATSVSPEGFEDAEIERIQREHNRLCFIYGGGDYTAPKGLWLEDLARRLRRARRSRSAGDPKMAHQSQATVAAAPAEIEIEGQRFSDPFDIPADLSLKIQPEQYSLIFGIIQARYARLIRNALRKPGRRALLLCDRKVVATAEWADDFPLEEIRRIEREHDRVCFVYGSGDLVEESAWSAVRTDDAYPTIPVWLAPEDTPEPTWGQVGMALVADFDTGNPRRPSGLNAFDASLANSAGLFPGAHTIDKHLETFYRYSRTPALLGTEDEGGQRKAYKTVVRLVADWSLSPFVRANPRRRGFVGREIMFALGLRITLDPAARRTTIEFA